MLNNRNQVTYLLPNNLLIERIMTNIAKGVHSLEQHSITLGANGRLSSITQNIILQRQTKIDCQPNKHDFYKHRG